MYFNNLKSDILINKNIVKTYFKSSLSKRRKWQGSKNMCLSLPKITSFEKPRGLTL